MEVNEVVSGSVFNGVLMQLVPMIQEIARMVIPLWFGLLFAKFGFRKMTSFLNNWEFEEKNRKWEKEWSRLQSQGLTDRDYYGVHRGFWGKEARKHRRIYGGPTRR